MVEVSAKNLKFIYEDGNELVLNDINLDVEKGDFVCVIGQSGCGKSTFLRLLAGLEKSDPKQLTVMGKPITGPSLDRVMVFQDYGLFPWMSAGENITLALKQKYKDWNKEKRKQVALEWMHKCGLDDYLYDKLPLSLSGGQRQRVATAQAFALNAPIMLMDEPFGALDAVTASLLQDAVLNLWNSEGENKKTIFFITHSVDEALLLATDIIVLGQMPSKIIFQYSFKGKKKPTRDNMYTDPEIMELRNKLIKIINDDIQKKAHQILEERNKNK